MSESLVDVIQRTAIEMAVLCIFDNANCRELLGLRMFGLLSFVTALAIIPHPFHVSVAEAQWNEPLDRLQVALRLNPRDLEHCLGQTASKRVVLDGMSENDIRALIEPYLRDRIFLSNSPGSFGGEGRTEDRDTPEAMQDRHERFHWLGCEQDVRYTWVYFELARPKVIAEKLWLHNRVMFEVDATQINTLQLMRTTPPVAIRTTAQSPSGEIPVIASERAREKGDAKVQGDEGGAEVVNPEEEAGGSDR